MLSVQCKGCKHCLWTVGIGQGVRCTHALNQQFKMQHNQSPVMINEIPECLLYENKEQRRSTDQ